MQRRSSPTLTPLILWTLGAMAMLGPFATDTYTPALPAMAAEFGAEVGLPVGATLSAATLGMCLGQLLLGALSDRYGRRIIIILGGVVMAIAALVAALAWSTFVLIAMCFLMGFAISGGLAGGRAVVADLTTGEEATRPFALLAMMLSIGPIIGPVAGALLLTISGWRSIFVVVALFSAACSIAVVLFVPESLHPEHRQNDFSVILKSYWNVITTRSYFANGLVLWSSFGVMFAYIASSTFIIQNNLGLPPIAFAISFAVNGIGLIGTSLLTAKWSHTVRPRSIMMFGAAVQLAAVIALTIIVASGNVNVVSVLVVLFVLGIVLGFIFGPSTALAMADVRHAAGTASALLGSLQFAFASVAAILVVTLSSDALVALTITSLGGEVIVFFALWLGARTR